MAKQAAVTWTTVRRLALALLPGVEEGTAYGTPALRVRGRFLGRLHEDSSTLVLKVGFEERDLRLQADAGTFYVTPHYRDYPIVLVRLTHVHPGTLRDILEQAWRVNAPKRLVAQHDAAR